MFGLFGLVGFFTGLWAAIKATIIAGAVGGAIGGGAAFLGRIFPGITTILVAAALGAVVMVGAFQGGYTRAHLSASAAADVARLEAEKAKIEHDLAALNEVRTFEQARAAEWQVRLDEQQAALDQVTAVIEKHQADKDACATGAFGDELDAIRKLQ